MSDSQLPQKTEFLLYRSEDGTIRVETRMFNESIWLSINQMAELFGVDKSGVSRHLKNIFETGELAKDSVVAKIATTAGDGKTYQVDTYNLDVIISVGYRVNSIRGTQFRIWATERLREYLVKGFVMDDERLKNPPVGPSAPPDYFDEMLERIRDIRASERRMYLRVKEIFAMAGDYQPSWPEITKFFSVIQNKLHFAATGMTAAELIQSRADHLLPNMGLSSWKGGQVRKGDVSTAKNYLSEDEIGGLNRIVVMWLDYAEDQALLRKQVFMKDWERKLDEFLRFNERCVLTHAGTVSRKEAASHAGEEYKQFDARRRELKEAEGGADYLRQLQDAARLLPAGKPKEGEKKEEKKKGEGKNG